MTDTPKSKLADSVSEHAPKPQTEDVKPGAGAKTKQDRPSDVDLGSGVDTSAIEPGKSGGATAL
jgi:hypothetical protein